MSKKQVMNILELDERQLDWLEDDYLRMHKENIDRVKREKVYKQWYINALMEWKSKRYKYIPPTH